MNSQIKNCRVIKVYVNEFHIYTKCKLKLQGENPILQNQQGGGGGGGLYEKISIRSSICNTV